MTMLVAAMLGILQEKSLAVLTLTEGVEPDEFFASRLTQREVLNLIKTLAATAESLPPEAKNKMLEINWTGWTVISTQIKASGSLERDALWFTVRSLIPATMLWLRVFRKNEPQLFSLTL